MPRLLWIVLSNLLLWQMSDAHKILVVIPLPSRSHTILGDRLVQILADAGNEVTYITSFPQENPPADVRQISLLDEDSRKLWIEHLDLEAIINGDVKLNNLKGFITMVSNINWQTLKHKDVQGLMNDPNEKFDVVIAEWMYSDIYSGLAVTFDCPFIWLSTNEHHWRILRMIDITPSPAYTADIMSSNQPPFNFLQRVQELKIQISALLLESFYTSKIQNEQYESVIVPSIRRRGKAAPLYEEVRFNASLVLGNSHVSVGSSISLPQNYKLIGGFHIPQNITPLTGDLKNLMDNAKNGVIYFSLGGNLKSESFPENLKTNLLKVFGELKQIVIWKFGGDIPNKPSNVHILKWVPQHSILAHPNCILFITHGGYLSMIEAIHFAKPLIGIPVFGDQFSNVARAVSKGFAMKVDLSYNMPDDIRDAIREIFTNPSYATRAKELSFIYLHRPASPSAEALHWVEHVIKTRGALHLRSPALSVTWYQKMYLDLLLSIFVILFGFKVLIQRLYWMSRIKSVIKKKKN